MSKLASKQLDREEVLEEFEDDIGDNDYVFVLGEDGQLKTIFLPDDVPMSAPENVQTILTMFGINDIDSVCKNPTLH